MSACSAVGPIIAPTRGDARARSPGSSGCACDRLDRDDVLQAGRRRCASRSGRAARRSAARRWPARSSARRRRSARGRRPPPGRAPVSRVARALTRTNRPTRVARPRTAAIDVGRPCPRRRLQLAGHRVLEVEHDRVRRRGHAPCPPRPACAPGTNRMRCGTAFISSSAAGRGRARRCS